MKKLTKRLALSLFSLLLLNSLAPAQTLRAGSTVGLIILDPIWTSAYITRNHGYMVYDTLFAVDANGNVHPQMIGNEQRSADGLTYTMSLRPDLLWHDGKPVTAEDCIASIKRWAVNDSLGQKMMSFVEKIEAQGSDTIAIHLRQPTNLVPDALAKPSSFVPFMMPKRLADTPANQQIKEVIGSGPFVFVQNEWIPGYKAVYARFKDYKPRAEPPSGLAGGKVVKVDRVEMISMPDPSVVVMALAKGEIDYADSIPHDLLPLLEKEVDVRLITATTPNQYILRPNHLQKPFDNSKVRQALWWALNQEDFLTVAVGNPRYYRLCTAVLLCSSKYASPSTTEGLLTSNFEKSKALLREANYDGTPAIIMNATDLKSISPLASVAKSLLERGGFKIEMVSMDWQSVIARRNKKEGWNIFFTNVVGFDALAPLSNLLSSNCEHAFPGWPCNESMELLRDRFAHPESPVELKENSVELQAMAEQTTPYVPLGEWYNVMAVRRNLSGVNPIGIPLFWGISKQ